MHIYSYGLFHMVCMLEMIQKAFWQALEIEVKGRA